MEVDVLVGEMYPTVNTRLDHDRTVGHLHLQGGSMILKNALFYPMAITSPSATWVMGNQSGVTSPE